MAATAQPVEMKKSLTLTGITVNAMALIAPGAFLWTTFQVQAALTQPHSTVSTASAMWPGLLFALVLALLTAYSYSELARIYPDAGTGSSYFFAEAALLDKEGAHHRKWARVAKLSVGWISHLYYWIYPGIMVAFTGTLFGYIYTSLTNGKTLNYGELGGRVRRVRARRRLHRLPRHQRLDDDRHRDQRHPDHDAGADDDPVHRLPRGASARRLRSHQRGRGDHPQELHERALPVDDRHPAAGRLRVGDGSRRRGHQPPERTSGAASCSA